MHVLYLIGQNSGGLPHYSAELANAVAKTADVTVMKPTETTADDMFDEGVELVDAFESISVSMPKLYRFDVDPAEFLRGIASFDNVKRIPEIDPDIVHDTTGMFPQTKFFTALHDIDDAYPLVVTRHEVPMKRFSLSRPPVMFEEVLHAILPELVTAKTIVHTDSQKEALTRQGVPSDDIDVIPHGAYSVFGTAEDIDDEPEPNTLLFFGNVVPPKGIDTLVEAIPLIKREIPDVKLIVAGDGKLPKASRSIIEAHPENFEIRNYFVPNEEVKDLFGRAEVVVTPYRSQDGTKGHSGALATAFAFGKPVVASTAGDFPALVEGTGSGTVVPPEDPRRLAEAIADLLRDRATRAEMARNSRRMARELSWDSIAERHLELYRSLLADPVERVRVNEP